MLIQFLDEDIAPADFAAVGLQLDWAAGDEGLALVLGGLAVPEIGERRIVHNEFTVKLDGYLDPTKRQNLIVSANVVNEFSNGSASGMLLVGLEFVDTDNKNYRYNTFFNNRAGSEAGEPTDQQIFNITRPLNIAKTSTGLDSTVDYTTDLKSSSESDLTVTSFYLQGDIDFSDSWKMIIGGRLDNFDITVNDVKKSQDQSRKDDMF